MPRVDLKHLFSLEVDFPPLPEQKRIAEELDRRLALIAEARLAAAELLESPLFRETFGGATPVSIGYGEGVCNPFAQAQPLPQSSAKGLKNLFSLLPPVRSRPP